MINSHLLADIQERLHKDGVTIGWVRDRTGMGEREAVGLLTQLGAVRDGGGTKKYRIPSVERKANSQIHIKGRR